MPTAVMTESSENTMSRIMIWTITAANEPAAFTVLACSSPSSRPWISQVALAMRNRPPPSRMRSRPEMSRPATVNSGCVSPTTQPMASSSRMRMPMAANRPTCRARACCSTGSLPARIEMNTMLSMPSTISRVVSVIRAIQASGSVSSSTWSSSGSEPAARGQGIARRAPRATRAPVTRTVPESSTPPHRGVAIPERSCETMCEVSGPAARPTGGAPLGRYRPSPSSTKE